MKYLSQAVRAGIRHRLKLAGFAPQPRIRRQSVPGNALLWIAEWSIPGRGAMFSGVAMDVDQAITSCYDQAWIHHGAEPSVMEDYNSLGLNEVDPDAPGFPEGDL